VFLYYISLLFPLFFFLASFSSIQKNLAILAIRHLSSHISCFSHFFLSSYFYPGMAPSTNANIVVVTVKPRWFRHAVEALQDYKSLNRSKDLIQQSRKFDAYKTKLRSLIVALQEQHEAASKMNKVRMKVCLIPPLLLEKVA
jgi:hypothetical protein